MEFITRLHLKIAHLKSNPHLSGDNELRQGLICPVGSVACLLMTWQQKQTQGISSHGIVLTIPYYSGCNITRVKGIVRNSWIDFYLKCRYIHICTGLSMSRNFNLPDYQNFTFFRLFHHFSFTEIYDLEENFA